MRRDQWLPPEGRLLLSVYVCFEKAFANASFLTHSRKVYHGSLSWICEQAEMKLKKRGDTVLVQKAKRLQLFIGSKGSKVIMQLEGIQVDEQTQEAIEDWHYWVNRGYEL
jgi:hypothetical protein